MSDIVVYHAGELELKISVNEENIWLNQLQISELFETSTDNISLHLKNIYKEKRYEETIEICKKALSQKWASDWEHRIERCEKKLNKQNT